MNLDFRRRQAWRGTGRLLRYSLAAILLLSLPTFSYLVPHMQETPVGSQGNARGTTGQAHYLASADLGGSRFSGGVGGFVGGGGGFVSRSPRDRAGFASGRNGGFNTARNSRRGISRKGATGATDPVTPEEARQRVLARAQGAATSAAAESIQRELAQMENDLQAAYSYFFPGETGSRVYSNNPFLRELSDSGGSGNSDQNGQEDPSGDDSGNSGSNTDSGSGSNDGNGTTDPSNGGGDPQQPPAGGNPEDELDSQFLVLGLLDDSDPGRFSFQAQRNVQGTYTLDTGRELSLLSGVVGFARPTVLAEAGQQLLVVNSGSNHGRDYILTDSTSVGSTIRSFAFVGADLREHYSRAFLFDLIRSAAVFDFDGNGTDEVAIAFVKNPNLVIYDVADGGLVYQRELVLPFSPALLVNTVDQRGTPTRYLQAYNAGLTRSVTFSSRLPAGAYSYSRPPTYLGVQDVEVTAPADSETRQYTVVQYEDRIVVLSQADQANQVLISFDFGPDFPIVLIGDYLQNGLQQTLFLP